MKTVAIVTLVIAGYWILQRANLMPGFLSNQGGRKMINVQALNDLLASKTPITLIDVREPSELKEDGKIAQAQNFPLSQLPSSYTRLPKDKTLYVICRSGNRSGKAQAFLQQHGYDAVNIGGGMSAWKSAGYLCQ